MANFEQSDRVRELAIQKYVWPALKSGCTRLSIRVRDVLKDVEATENFPRNRTPIVCQVLQGDKFLNATGLSIESIDGPPSKRSTTVVVHYQVTAPPKVDAVHRSMAVQDTAPSTVEEPAARARRLAERLRGLLQAELAEYGGAEGFLEWVRSDDVHGAA